jgi:hypothetical protein
MDGVEKLVEGYMSVCRELIEAKEEIFRMQGMISALVDRIEAQEIREAESNYSDRGDVERVDIRVKELKSILGMKLEICERAEAILQEREAKNGK